MIGGQKSSSALSLSPQKTSTLDLYSTEALSVIQNRLKIIQQRVPSLITKGVVYDGKRLRFSGGITRSIIQIFPIFQKKLVQLTNTRQLSVLAV